MAGIKAHWVWMGSKRGLERKRKKSFCAGWWWLWGIPSILGAGQFREGEGAAVEDGGGEMCKVGAPGGAYPRKVVVEEGGDLVMPWHRSAAPGVSDCSYADTYAEPPAVASG